MPELEKLLDEYHGKVLTAKLEHDKDSRNRLATKIGEAERKLNKSDV